MNKELNLVHFPNGGQESAVIGNNVLSLTPFDIQEIEFHPRELDFQEKIKKSQAFSHEFYKEATDRQIEDDVISYLGEYRFEISEFDYELDLVDGDLVDPASSESMIAKAKKAVDYKRRAGLNISREEAETEGLLNLRAGIKNNPEGTIIWFSPPGRVEEGYGEYGFAYVGHKDEDKLKMTAIRLENPQMDDFNRASKALWECNNQTAAEDFLRSPQVLDIDINRVREFIHGNFEIKEKKQNEIFQKVRKNLHGVIEEYKLVIREGVEERMHQALHVVENLSLELKSRYEQDLGESNLIFPDIDIPSLVSAMQMKKYLTPLIPVKGSCGITSKNNVSNDIFRGIKTNADKTPTLGKRDFSFDSPGPCRICEKDVPCGPCKICESCNDRIDAAETND